MCSCEPVTTCLAPLVRVLVTGHRGLIGRATTAELTARGHTVVGFDLVDGDDIHDTVAVDRAIQNCEAVVHLAALDEPVADPADAHLGPASVGTDAQVLETNVVGTSNVLRAAEKHPVSRVVLMSSVDVLGCFDGTQPPNYLPLDDNHPVRPVGAYATSKWLAEQLCEATTVATGITTVCLRPPGIFSETVYAAIKQARRDNPDFEWSPLWQYGAFLDVRDLATAVDRALTAPLTGHHRLLLCAADISSAHDDGPTLVRRLLPELEWLGGPEFDADRFRSLINSDPAQTLLQWAPQHRWRKVRDLDQRP